MESSMWEVARAKRENEGIKMWGGMEWLLGKMKADGMGDAARGR
jgi:hypothetical protein